MNCGTNLGLAGSGTVCVCELEEFIVLQREVEISFQFRILGTGRTQDSIFTSF